jgi:hypothetical protein
VNFIHPAVLKGGPSRLRPCRDGARHRPLSDGSAMSRHPSQSCAPTAVDRRRPPSTAVERRRARALSIRIVIFIYHRDLYILYIRAPSSAVERRRARALSIAPSSERLRAPSMRTHMDTAQGADIQRACHASGSLRPRSSRAAEQLERPVIRVTGSPVPRGADLVSVVCVSDTVSRCRCGHSWTQLPTF